MELNYTKNKNSELFNELSNESLVNIKTLQNYIPIYCLFFDLNDKNYNSINLNTYYKLTSIKSKFTYSKFSGTIKDNSNNSIDTKIFFKYSPLIDPIKFMTGKYDNSYNILKLPKIKNDKDVIEKILDKNNSAYSDSFFSFLSSLLLNKFNFLNGIDFYGSFLGIKNNFIVNIEDDLEYLDDSDFFHKYNNKLFNILDNDNCKNYFNNTKKNKQALKIDNSIYEKELHICELDKENDENNLSNIEIEYTTNLHDKKKIKTNELNNSEKSCSSRYSNTNSTNDEDSESEISDDSSNEYDSSDADDEILANILEFPVQTIALECCDDTLDSYIMNNKKLSDDEWESIVLQVIFTLIVYQKVFDFTHNDLHSNNIVYKETDKKYLYYKYDNKHYKVPTYGKIYKIIDFGRAIYKYKGNIICSDSYAIDGDAHTQYNTEPYFNENKPRLEPNYSFDLCRLGCSLFDYLIDNVDDIHKLKSPIKKLIIQWVYDDSNKNILYKNNGSERYPDFKLYKMIARTVHKHNPSNVIKNSIFEKNILSKKRINNQSAILNIDNLPILK